MNPSMSESFSTVQDPYVKWASTELHADRTHVWPSTGLSNNDNADPYATVLFSDIRHFLLPLRSRPAQLMFRLAWLSFAGLHIPGFLESISSSEYWDDRWFSTRYSTHTFLTSVMPNPTNTSQARITADSVAGVLVGRERAYGSAFGPVKSWSKGILHPLADIGGNAVRMWNSRDVAGVDAEYARRIFQCCRIGPEDSEWDVLYLAFEAAHNVQR